MHFFQVQAEILIIDKDDVVVGLGEVVKDQKVTTLVMGVKRRYITTYICFLGAGSSLAQY